MSRTHYIYMLDSLYRRHAYAETQTMVECITKTIIDLQWFSTFASEHVWVGNMLNGMHLNDCMLSAVLNWYSWLASYCLNIPYDGSAGEKPKVHLLKNKTRRSRHQCLFEENVRKTKRRSVNLKRRVRELFTHGEGISTPHARWSRPYPNQINIKMQ